MERKDKVGRIKEERKPACGRKSNEWEEEEDEEEKAA